MKYSVIDLQVEDIMWFGIDTNKCIFSCTTAGCANVPLFVCESREKNEMISNFFINELTETTTELLETTYENNDLINDAVQLARKGIFCFDAVIDDDTHSNEYVRIASPSVPLHFEELPNSIKGVLMDHMVNADVSATKYLHLSHAY